MCGIVHDCPEMQASSSLFSTNKNRQESEIDRMYRIYIYMYVYIYNFFTLLCLLLFVGLFWEKKNVFSSSIFQYCSIFEKKKRKPTKTFVAFDFWIRCLPQWTTTFINWMMKRVKWMSIRENKERNTEEWGTKISKYLWKYVENWNYGRKKRNKYEQKVLIHFVTVVDKVNLPSTSYPLRSFARPNTWCKTFTVDAQCLISLLIIPNKK